MKLAFAVVLIVSMIFFSSFLQATMAYQLPTRPPGAPSICDKKCGVRCNEARYNARCLKFCGICCDKCQGCVPSGTSGNKAECPCYKNMLNSKGQPKCP